PSSARGLPADPPCGCRSGDAFRYAAEAGAPGRGGCRSKTGSADERGARGDQAFAAGELRAAPRERDPEVGERVFCQGARPRPTEVSRYVDEHRGRFGVEPIGKTLEVSAPAYAHWAS